jgi:uncharacterized protein
LEKYIAQLTGHSHQQVRAVLKLTAEGATIPFIARYRKEATQGLDEVDIAKILSIHQERETFKKRKKTVLEKLIELNIQNEVLLAKIKDCEDAKILEDLYLPYKQKRKTKASIAKELGLTPLAKIIMAQRQTDISYQAKRFARGRFSESEAIEGAQHIIAEWISENEKVRGIIRNAFQNHAQLASKVVKGKTTEGDKYRDYFDFSQSTNRLPSHRILAMFRAEKEGILKLKVDTDVDYILNRLERIYIKNEAITANILRKSIKDSCKRLLFPSIENEVRSELKLKADEEAISLFSKNLSQLLLAPPLGSKSILAIDPGFKTGCKTTCLSASGELQHHTTIFPHPPQNKTTDAKQKLLFLIQKYKIEAVAVGDGTAGRETERFVSSALKTKHPNVEVYLISESGASIYSASEVGRAEFPDIDLTVRGSVSIGRRLMDPLAELVKIDPKSIGVGQYQHDVAQDKLKQSLDNTVSFAVNRVGVNLNTASKHLLQYVSGIGPKLAEAITEYRQAQGKFNNRNQLKKVKGLGSKAFEQAAGFLRIKGGDEALDQSGVHPERYPLVKEIARDGGVKVKELIGDEVRLKSVDLQRYVNEEVGLETLNDIIEELLKPGLDPRGEAKTIVFDDKVKTIEDVRGGMVLNGKVTNITKFGAFIDIGIKENGLLHISEMSDRRISDPLEVVSLNQQIKVLVKEVDLERKRIGLSLKITS